MKCSKRFCCQFWLFPEVPNVVYTALRVSLANWFKMVFGVSKVGDSISKICQITIKSLPIIQYLLNSDDINMNIGRFSF